jgi:DNA polymerase-3 subunit alpha
LNPKLINKRTLENLVAAGALDELDSDRARATAAIDPMMSLAQRAAEASTDGTVDMFGGVTSAEVTLRIPPYSPWTQSERLQKELGAVGFFLSGHPLDEYGEILKRMRVQTWVDLCRSVRGGASVGRLAATVLDRYERRTKTGSKMGIVELSDQTGHFEAIIFSEGLQKYRDVLEPGRAVVLIIQAAVEGDDVRARIQSAEPLDQAAAKHQRGMRIFLNDDRPMPAVLERLTRGEGEVSIVAMLDGEREVELKLPGRYNASPHIAGALRTVPGILQVEMS